MKKLQLLLTNPCTERWDDLQPASAGRYCDRCEKNIIDLTTKSDLELIEFFKKKKENVCGRLLSSQLNRELVLPPAKANWHWLLPLAIGAIAMSPAQANELRPVVVHGTRLPVLPVASTVPAVQPHLMPDTLSGSVVDGRTGKGLKGVKVREKGFENVLALTDSAGRFTFHIQDGNHATAFTFELSGYSRMEAQASEGMVVKLAEQSIMLGGVSAVSLHRNPLFIVYVGKKSWTIDRAKLSEIKPDWIEKLEILKDAKATSIYGSKAANGVMLIEIKKAYAKKIDFSKEE